MLDVQYRNAFKKDLKRAELRGKDVSKIQEIIRKIRKREQLDPKHKNHKLKGEYVGCWECHVEPDWLFVYEIIDNTLFCYRTGTHSDLFG